MSEFQVGVFEFDSVSGVLTRDGYPIKLQSQPARVLAVLLEQAGEIVTRKTLQAAVWRGETFVDFDRGLNFCIAQIRSAFGDSAETPRYIRTVPKKGCQFIAPVRVVGALPVVIATPHLLSVGGTWC
jgi:DNA-binding winged helix-turn-helix (wHTH) protein